MLRKKMKLTNEHETASTANADFNAYQYHQPNYPKPPASFSNFYYPYMPPYDNGLSYDVGISRFFPIPPGYIPPGQVSMPPVPQVPVSVPPVPVPQMQVPPRSVASMMPLQRSIPTSDSFLQIEQTLNMNLASLQYQHPVSYVYNPVEYAYNAHAAFVRKYCNVEKRVLLLGMNPGPHGMCQTGIPFGNTDVCKEWFNIDMPIGQPPVACPNKKVVGFEYHRQEISGKRLWTVFKDLCGSAENFFRYSYIHNYCPLAFFDEKGKNITPSDLRVFNTLLIAVGVLFSLFFARFPTYTHSANFSRAGACSYCVKTIIKT